MLSRVIPLASWNSLGGKQPTAVDCRMFLGAFAV
jgi:hypothetical protein